MVEFNHGPVKLCTACTQYRGSRAGGVPAYCLAMDKRVREARETCGGAQYVDRQAAENELRATALAKLTDEEKRVLGLGSRMVRQ